MIRPVGTRPATQEVKKEARRITNVEKKIMKNTEHFVSDLFAATQKMGVREVRLQKNHTKLQKPVKRAFGDLKESSAVARRQWSSQGRQG